MERKKIAVIGIGGRTGSMFAFELKNSADVLGVGRDQEAQFIENENLYLKRGKAQPELFREKVIKDTDFDDKINPDIILLATKNPVSAPIKYYYQRVKKKLPVLLLSQNGLAVIKDSQKALQSVLGSEWEKVTIVRIVLFNPIDREKKDGQVFIKYSLPVRVALAKASGPGEIKDLLNIFNESGIEFKEFSFQDADNLQFSKLFLNLIGMAAASQDQSIEQGFLNQAIFEEEILSLKEYIKVVKASDGKFLNLPHYPVKIMAELIEFLPVNFLSLFKSRITYLVSKGRDQKPKDLDEIDYYNGWVVKLGQEKGVKTPVNKKIYERVLDKNSGRVGIRT